jgi:hypothetical protein
LKTQKKEKMKQFMHFNSIWHFNGRQSDDLAFGYVQSSFGFKVEIDVGIKAWFAPFWLLGTHYLNLAAWFD